MSESVTQKEILLAVGARADLRVWRNNTAVAWVGDHLQWRGRTLIISNARPLHAGLCVGSSDLIGIQRVRIERDMVGTDIGRFCAIEVKAPRGRPTKEQKAFLGCIGGFGGIAGVARSADDAIALIEGGILV